jgi:CDP-diacylglycerol--serine O-phosphatidyltransferase
MAFCVWQGWILDDLPFGVVFPGTILEFHPLSALFVLNGSLMVSKTLHVPKP